MRGRWSPFRLPPRWRWLMWPALGLGGSGAAAGAWLVEEPFIVAGEVCFPLAILSGLYAVVYGFCHRVFRAHALHRNETHQHPTKRN